jgi:hypothetical protein
MATAAQIHANRENAQKSTGPITGAGILKASQNAIRHSLTSTLALTRSEQPEDAREVLAALHLEFRPLGANEEILVHKMAEHLWHQARANRYLVNLLNDGGGPNIETRIALFLRYHGAADRGYYRGLNELRKVQKERRLVENGSVSSAPEAPSQKPAPEPPKTPDPAPQAAPFTEKAAATAPPNEKNAA